MPEVHEALSAYVPMDRRAALVAGVPLPERSHGAVLFADISGFTPLTAVLAQELGAERGVEMLSDQLNQVYGALIDKVHQYRGSVISFAGDAITCWFDVDDGQRAVAAAQAMQQVMIRFSAVITPSNITIPFGIKISITTGEISRFLVGQPQMLQIDVLAGQLMDRVAAGEKVAQQDETVVSQDIVDLLGLDIFEWRTTSSGEKFGLLSPNQPIFEHQPWPLLPPIDIKESQNWLLPPVFQRLSQGLGDFLAELRPAVALFVKFDGLNYDEDSEAGQKLDHYICWVQTVLNRYEGVLLQLTMGDKGSYFYALFGAPIAHEDDEARAVAAALDLQKLPAEFDFIQDVQIGISQGTTYVGAFGSYHRRTFGAIGEQVNVAARLMSLAEPGEILVSQIVANTAVRFAYADKGKIQLKGIQQPQSVFQVIAAQKKEPQTRLKGRDLVEMVGREQERETLSVRLNALLDGRSSQILIEGEAGIGKSRLVADLLMQAAALGIMALHGTGDAIEQHTSYHAWRAVFRTCFEVDETDEASHLQTKVLNRIDKNLHERAPLLNAVLPLNLADTMLTTQLSREVRASNTRELLATIIADVPRKSGALLLILEDGHWFDSASWALMEVVSKLVSPLMLVIVTRPLSGQTSNLNLSQLDLAPEYRRFRDHPETVHLSLSTLKPEEAEALVCSRLGVDQLPEVVSTLIQKRAEGHPFFSEELAFALRDSGLIRVQDGRCELTAPAAAFQSLEFPDTIQGVITSRIDRLDPGHQLTLKVASVIGRVFLYQALHDIHPVPNDKSRLISYLETLDRLDITPLETPAPEMSYIFKHVTIQEVAYGLLLFAQRKQLHHLTAEWIEVTNGVNLAPHYPLLAHHWSRAEVPEKAILYLEKAGQEALQNGAFREVIDFIEEVVTLADSLPSNRDSLVVDDFRRARWQLLLGDAHFGLGQLIESRTYFLSALSLLGWPMPETPQRKTVQHLLLQFCHYLFLVIFPEKWRFFFGKPSAEKSARRLAAAHAYEPLGLVYYFSSETNQAVYTALHRFILAKKARQATAELARGYASVCGIFMLVGLRRLGIEYGRQARKIARQINDIPALAWALLSTAVFSIGVAPWEKVEGWLKEGMALNQRLLDKRTMGDTTATLLNVLFAQDKYDEAFEVSDQLAQLGHESGNMEHVAWGITGKANALLRQGQTNKAIEQYQKALVQFEQVAEDYVHEAEAIGMLAMAYLRQGRLEEAEAEIARLVRLIPDQIPSSYVLFPAFYAMVEVRLARWGQEVENTAVSVQAKEALSLMHRFARHHPIGKPRALILQGRFEWLAGNKRRAWRAWRQAARLANKQAMRYEQGYTHLEMARRLPQTDGRRKAYFAVAKARFAEIGAVWETAVVTRMQAEETI